MIKLILLATISLFTYNTNAQQITLVPANEEEQGIQLSVSISDGATKMPLAGKGLGTRKIGLANVKIAVNEFFCERPENLNRTFDGIYPSLKNVGKIAFKVTLLRGVGSDLIESSINDAISLNLSTQEVNTYQSDIQQVTSALLSEDSISYGTSIIFIAYPDKNQVLYQNSAGSLKILQFRGAGFVYKLFAVWFGEQARKEGDTLKTLLLEVPQVTRQ